MGNTTDFQTTDIHIDDPCDYNYFYNFPKPPVGQGYVPVYGNDIIYKGDVLSGTWGTNIKTTITSTARPPSETRRTRDVYKTCDGE